MFPVNSPDNRPANPVEARTDVRHKRALLQCTQCPVLTVTGTEGGPHSPAGQAHGVEVSEVQDPLLGSCYL